MRKHINYIEMPATDLAATRAFFEALFGWEFEGWGDEYISFKDGDLDGGFYRTDKQIREEHGSALVIFFGEDLEAMEERVVELGATILKPTFSFPGGRRFHFLDPSGNEFAVWGHELPGDAA